MRLSNDRPRRRTINLTPLIDVVFLLLVFFMLASTFLRFSAVNIEAASGGASPKLLAGIAILHIGQPGTWRLNGEPIARQDLGRSFGELVETGRGDLVIVVRDGAKASDVVLALALARESAFTSVRVVE